MILVFPSAEVQVAAAEALRGMEGAEAASAALAQCRGAVRWGKRGTNGGFTTKNEKNHRISHLMGFYSDWMGFKVI